MQLFKILPFLFAAVSSAFVLPEIRSDGAYSVYIDKNGKEVHERVDTNIPSLLNSTLSPRNLKAIAAQSPRIWCGCGFTLDNRDCDAAVEGLKRYFVPNPWVQPMRAQYYIAGRVVVFACNYNPGQLMYGSPDNIGRAMAAITGNCGWYIAGTLGWQGNALDQQWGYMRYAPGVHICSWAKSSPRNHC